MPKADSAIPVFVGLSRKADPGLPGNSLALFSQGSHFSNSIGAENCTVTILLSWSSRVFPADLLLRNSSLSSLLQQPRVSVLLWLNRAIPCLKWGSSFTRQQSGDAVILSCCLSVLHWKGSARGEISSGINEMILLLFKMVKEKSEWE